jgi:hypothetical protein
VRFNFPAVVTYPQTLWATWVSLWVERQLGIPRRTSPGAPVAALPDVCRKLGIAAPHSPPEQGATLTLVELQLYVRLARRALSLAQLQQSCLRQCLLIGYLSQRAGPALRVGLAPGSGVSPHPPLDVHAWLEFSDGSIWDPNQPELLTSQRNPQLRPLRTFTRGTGA